jgi:hypothetical protein
MFGLEISLFERMVHGWTVLAPPPNTEKMKDFYSKETSFHHPPLTYKALEKHFAYRCAEALSSMSILRHFSFKVLGLLAITILL